MPCDSFARFLILCVRSPLQAFIPMLCLLAISSACTHRPAASASKRVIVIGVDGMDPGFLERHFEQLPNLNRLRRNGEFKRLGTTVPPQSPVAWSSFITGMDPGGHGIFDFLHRDLSTRKPFSSMAEVTEARRTISIGSFVLPLSSARAHLLRHGTAFWRILADHGVPATLIRIPNNFPPDDSRVHALSGMGTPDLQGSFGTFSYYTNDPAETRQQVAGGRIERIELADRHAVIDVRGPVDPFLRNRPVSTVRCEVHLDQAHEAARLDFEGGTRIVLRRGEWSDWVRVRFPVFAGLKRAAGTLRLFLRQVSPYLRLYVSPVNIDPLEPELPISTPGTWSRDLAENLGLFYTQGTSEDTSALRAEVLSHNEYIAQSRMVLDESLRMFRHELDRFDAGFFFYYFSSIDQNSHILWGRYEPELLSFYQAIDVAIGEAAAKAGEDSLLMIISDHGFAAFDRAVNLNTWLMREGFMTLDDPSNTGPAEMFAHVDWTKTKAYALGLNSLYLNLKGREQDGSVSAGDESEGLIRRLRQELLRFRDPDNGRLVVQSVYRPAEIYKGGELRFAPELIVGYAPGYRSSWQTALGGVPDLTMEDNTQAWIADHCIASEAVPGAFLSNRKIRLPDPMLWDVTTTILHEFGIPGSSGMAGRALY
jgi:predicted AlkP superfamily phosphohydrolase/phosphomutase